MCQCDVGAMACRRPVTRSATTRRSPAACEDVRADVRAAGSRRARPRSSRTRVRPPAADAARCAVRVQWNGPLGIDCERPSSVSVLCSALERKRSRSTGSSCRAGARIDEQRHAVDRERQRQRVGVRVAAVQEAVRAAVDDEMIARRAIATRSSRCRSSAPEPCGATTVAVDDGRRGRGEASAGPAARTPPPAPADPRDPGGRGARRGRELSRTSSGARPRRSASVDPPSSSPMCGRRPRSSASRRAAEARRADGVFEDGIAAGSSVRCAATASASR